MDDNEINNLAYSLWEQAGRPDGRSEHFWQLARDRLDKASFQHDSDDPTIWEFDKRVRNSEHPISFWGDVWRIQGLFAQAADKAFGVVPAAPEILWHYTTGSNVASIIQSGEIWSTRLDCLNDSSEYQLAFKLLSKVLSFRPLSTSSENERNFHTYLSRRFSERPRYFEDCFVACFSAERNDLSQLRAYGGPQGENGFAIGFDAHALHLSLPPHLSLQRVEYSDQCLRQYLSIIIEGLFSFYLEGSAWDENRHSLRRAWEDITYTCFERAAICRFPSFKDEAFKAENEWRLITMDGWKIERNF